MPIPSQQTPFMNVLIAEQMMDSQAIIERLNRDVKDKTLLVRFYNIQNGSDIWIDGLCWRLYDFDMAEYLHEEFGIDVPENLMYDVLKADEDFINRTCFNSSGLFKQITYENVQDALQDFSEECIEAAITVGIDVDLSKLRDSYQGEHKSFIAFATERFNELERPELPERYRDWIDYEKYAESLEQQYHFSDGHVFDATT